MATLLTIALPALMLLFLLGLLFSRGGAFEGIRQMGGRGFRLTLGTLLLLLVAGLFTRVLITMDEETERLIVRGSEPGDTISRGFDTKARFVGLTTPLGKVFDRNGQLLASYSLVDRHLGRHYPYGETLAHIIGYWTGPVRDGVGVEKGLVYLNDSLRDNKPHDVTLSIDLRLQEDAVKALRGNAGAIVVLNPATGEVLAAASNPTYRPADVWENRKWKAYASNESTRPLLGRALKDIYSPGSSIKPIVAAAALHYDIPLPEEKGFVCTGEYDPGPGVKPITDHGSSHGKIDLETAMKVSCNTYFSYLADELIGFDRMQKFMESLGANYRLSWNTSIPLNRPGALLIAISRVEGKDKIARSRVGVGQASIKLNPLHAAVIYGGIAQGGIFLAPTLQSSLMPDTLGARLRAADTERLAKALRGPVTRGGTAAGIFTALERKGIKVYGKTGTADREPDGRAPSWFSSFGEKGNNRYVVVVALENRRGQYAGNLNAPMARQMYESLQTYGYFAEVE